MSIAKRVKNWWQGRYVPPPPGHGNGLVLMGRVERPLPARIMVRLGRGLERHGMLVFTGIMALAAIITLFK